MTRGISAAFVVVVAALTVCRAGSEWPVSGESVVDSGARRPDGKARRPRIPGVFEGGATLPAGMPRPEGTTDSPETGHEDTGAVASAANATIRGRVELRQPTGDPGSRVSVADLGMSAMHAPIDRRSVVYLDPAPRAAFDSREDPRPRLDQRNETFVPHDMAIVAGTTVDFPNSDHTYHNVFSLSKTKSFDLGRYAVGHSKAVRFDRPGIVRVFCDIHSHMSAFILVFAHRYFSVADPDGSYRLENVPPGAYTVVAWNEAATLESRRVVVPDGGGEVEVNFALGRR